MKLDLRAVLLGLATAATAAISAQAQSGAQSGATHDWSGAFLGLSVDQVRSDLSGASSTEYVAPGYSYGSTYFQSSSVPAVNALGLFDFSSDDTEATLHGGYSEQRGWLVYGLELDLGTSGAGGSQTVTGSYPCCSYLTTAMRTDVSTDWTAALRSTVGYARGDWLFYATAGIAAAQVKSSFLFSDTAGFTGQGSATDTLLGYTAGLGVARAITDRLSLRVQYLHSDYGSTSYASNDFRYSGAAFPDTVMTQKTSLTSDRISIGLTLALGG